MEVRRNNAPSSTTQQHTKQAELELKLIIKRYGTDDEKAESKKLLLTANTEIDKLDAAIENLIADFIGDLKNRCSSIYDWRK